MTEAEKIALAMVNEVLSERNGRLCTERDVEAKVYPIVALCRAIEQHEAFKREVSEAVFDYFQFGTIENEKRLCRFIIPNPVDPLVEAIRTNWPNAGEADAEYLTQALAARGLQITEIGQ